MGVISPPPTWESLEFIRPTFSFSSSSSFSSPSSFLNCELQISVGTARTEPRASDFSDVSLAAWLRALFLGGSLHLDVTWVTRLVAAVLRARFRSCDPFWSYHGGTCSGALRSWFRSQDFTSVRPWVWRHPVASVGVDLSVRPGPKMLEPLNLSVLLNTMFGRAGGLGFRKDIPNVAGMRSTPFLSLIKNTRSWILSSPVAATGWVPRSVRVLTLVFLRLLVLLLARGGAGMSDSGSTSLGRSFYLFLLFKGDLLHSLVLFMLSMTSWSSGQ